MDGVESVVTPRTCKLEGCGADVPPPARRNLVREFCSDKHRAAWHLDQRRKHVAQLRDGLVRTQDDLEAFRLRAVEFVGEAERLQAVIGGALALIETGLVVGRKPPRNSAKNSS